ncbi:hypothetical protein PEPE_0866 [Pediococcus pentosaceus ATCC 25745]|uniref:Uncharacterized protein n=1 Tax=Pediococcus pentosaceus (strain ATCC 25745 / CCUG 21536 / LMG 10740 / 183-1w) TaxID=278197 RepID=Q03FU7_PEDPA|nr:hypothetical protein PEPE_0866 [Pediococcus pentosaceus ATCC 25745]
MNHQVKYFANVNVTTTTSTTILSG